MEKAETEVLPDDEEPLPLPLPPPLLLPPQEKPGDEPALELAVPLIHLPEVRANLGLSRLPKEF